MIDYENYLRIKHLLQYIHSEWIKQAARQEGDLSSWTRRRDMPLDDILLCTLGKKGLSTTMELRQYFQAVEKMEQTVSKQNYLQQRKKLNPEVFKLLNANYLREFYEGQQVKTWQGYVVLDIDGSKAEIPDSQENRQVYGQSSTGYGKAQARAALSVLHDVFNRFILDIGIDHCLSSEIEQAKTHIQQLKEIVGGRPVIVMFDRNYASLEFMDFLEKAGVKYLIRLSEAAFKAEVGGMKAKDQEVELEHTKARMRNIKQSKPQRAQELEQQRSTGVRIVKTVLATGQKFTLITNLKQGTAAQIRALYRKRWLIEQRYHTLKNKLKFESVTGKASIYVKQDFWAQTVVYNMVEDMITGAEYRASGEAKKKRLRYEVRINENIAIGLFKEQFIRLMIEQEDSRKDQMFRSLIAEMQRNIVPVRKLKSSPRKWKHYNKYKCNLKPSF